MGAEGEMKEEEFWAGLVVALILFKVRIDLGFGDNHTRCASISAGFARVEVRFGPSGPLMMAPPTRGWVPFDMPALKASLGFERAVP